MSKFKTSIPVDVASIKALLPEGHFLHGVAYDATRSEVSVIWEHDRFTTGRDFPIEFPREHLAEKTTPKGVAMKAPEVVEPDKTEATEATDKVESPAPNDESEKTEQGGAAAVATPPGVVPTKSRKPVAKTKRPR